MSEQDLIQLLAERLGSHANVKAVYGDPIVLEGKTVIPVAKIAYGFGGGSGRGKRAEGTEQPNWGEGQGGGGGVVAKPVGVVEITPEGTRFIHRRQGRKLAGVLLIGLALGFLMGRGRAKGF